MYPGSHRAESIADDRALVAAMLAVEVAWSRVLARLGMIPADAAESVAVAAAGLEIDVAALAVDAELTGNPVIGLVGALRGAVDVPDAVHRGLTSQDVLDTAFMILAKDATAVVAHLIGTAADHLARLAQTRRDVVMAGRTLTQWAVPITFGLKASQWLAGILDARDALDGALPLPVQCGGAAGTRALLTQMAPSADHRAAIAAFADDLGLDQATVPWHTRRRPITRVGDALTAATDAFGVVAVDVLCMTRPEIGEVSEAYARGRGGSSTMPHKRNPVLSVLISSASRRMPLDLAQLHLAAAAAVDERPDGAWHSEWPVLSRMLRTAVVVASQGADLIEGLQVNDSVLMQRAESAGAQLLAESGQTGEPAAYLGDTGHVIDAVLARYRAPRESAGRSEENS